MNWQSALQLITSRTVIAYLPVQPDFVSGEIDVDTIWFESWKPDGYYFPVYYETAIIDSLWTNTGELKLPSDITIHPNPARDFLYINLPAGHGYHKVQLVDINGVMKREREIWINDQSIKLDLNGLERGIFILRIDDGTMVYHKKVIITP